MRSHRSINSLLYLVIQLVAKESKAKENNAVIGRLFVPFLEKRHISCYVAGFLVGTCKLGEIVNVNADLMFLCAFVPRHESQDISSASLCMGCRFLTLTKNLGQTVLLLGSHLPDVPLPFTQNKPLLYPVSWFVAWIRPYHPNTFLNTPAPKF